MAAAPDVLSGLARSYLFEDLTREELAPLAAQVTTRSLGKGEYLFRMGDQADEIYVQLSGEVKDSVVDVDGNEVVHFVHGPGMTYGEPGFFAVDHHRIVEVVAVLPSSVIVMHRNALGPFMAQHPSVKDRALEGLASNTRWQSTMIAALFRRSLADRLGLRLLELADGCDVRVDGARATPRISQSTLASMVGVSREHVNRAVALLTDEGLVRQQQGHYVLLDEDALLERLERDGPTARRRDRRDV